MTLVIVCEINEQDEQLVHKCYNFTNPVDTSLVDMNLGRNRHIGRFYRIGIRGGISWRRPNFKVAVKEGVVHITTQVSCFKTGAMGPLEERFGGRPFSRRIGFVRDPQGLLRDSYKIGKQHKVVLRYAPLPEVPEVFEIIEAFEFGHSDVKMSFSKKKSDEDDKENKKKRKTAPKGKAGINGEEKSFGNRPFSPQIGAVRDPQGRLKKSFKEGRQHRVIVRYAPVAGEPEAFEIADVFEIVNGKERLLPPENRNDEEDKENDKKKKPAKKGKAGKAARRRAQRIP